MAGSFVNAVDPDGKPVKLPAENAEAAFKDGFRAETPDETRTREEEKKYGDRSTEAFAAGAGRGLTFGLSDLALDKFGLVNRETLQGLQKHNEGASTVGEVAGVGASLLIPGGAAGLVAKAGEAATGLAGRAIGAAAAEGGAGLAARLGAKAVGGAVEGGIFGLGQGVHEDWLEDGNVDLAAEKLLSHVGMGAVLGAGASGLGGLVDEAASKAAGSLKKLGATDIRAVLKSGAEERAVRSLNGTAGDFAGLNDRVGPMGRELLDRDLTNANWRDINQARQGVGKEIGQSLEKADAQLGEKQFNLGAFTKRAREEVLSKMEGDPALASDAAEIGKLVEGYEAKAADRIGFAEANQLKTSLAKKVNFKVDGDVKKEWVAKLGGILDDEIEGQLSTALGPDALASFQANKSSYGNLREATKIAKKAERRGMGNREFGLTDNMWALGAAATGNFGALGNTLLGGAAAGINKFARENGQGLMAKALDSIAESPTLERMAKGFQKAVEASSKATPEAFGKYAPVLAAASSRGPAELLVAHATLAQRDPAYREVMTRAGFGDESPEAAQAAIGRAERLTSIDRVAKEQDKALNSAVEGFLRGKGGAASTRQPISLKAYQKSLDELASFAAKPASMVDRLNPGATLSEVAPSVGASMATAAAKAAQFLHDKAPKSPYPPALPGMEREWKPSDMELSKWDRYVQAVNNPHSVLEDMQRGTVTKEAVEALRSVYPQLATDMQNRLTSALAERKRVLTYPQRMAIATLFGGNIEPTMTPEAIAGFQQQHAAAAQQAQKPPTTGQRFRVGQSATTSQRIEGK